MTSIDCDYALCVTVVPGDRHALVGTRSGRLQLFDIVSAELLEDIQAHQADEETNTDTGIWSLCLTHDSVSLDHAHLAPLPQEVMVAFHIHGQKSVYLVIHVIDKKCRCRETFSNH